jgi:8-oxo-dGTP pyrophosphatase MutT (NUDIX family)
MIQPWKKTSTRQLANFKIFTVRSDTRISPRTGASLDTYVLDCVNWVNVIAITPMQELVMVEQFRFGSETVELEIPGGTLNRDETDPLAAGLRELREETGYVGRNARLIGSILPNPAIMSNVCHTVLVEDCRCEHAIELDPGEDLATRLVPLAEVPALISAGKIRHSLVVVALYHHELLRRTR